MKKGEIYQGTVEYVAFPNKGHLTVEGFPVTVKNTVPGQKISFRLTKKRKDHGEGRLLEVLEKSSLESCERKCSIFPECGGCMYQTMYYDEQVKMKLEQVKKLLVPVLTGYGKYTNEQAENLFAGIEKSPVQDCYRNKMEYTFGDEVKDGPLTLGLHKKGSNFDILNATDCAIVHDDINKIVRCVLEYCTQKGFDYYHKMSHIGFLRNLLIRRAVSTGEIMAAIVTTSQEEHDFTELKDRICALPLEGSVVGVLHMTNDSVADVVRSEKTEILYGQDYFYEELLGLKFKISPFSFFQTNTLGAEVLYSVAREFIGKIDNATVFDLYSGTGTIGQILAPEAGKVIGVEIVEEAVEAAKENAALNGLDNCTFLAGDVLKMLDEIKEIPDYLVLDPPREGIHPKALEKIINYNAERIVYISCKPTSLARDLETLLQGGYKVECVKCVDMFPNTVHVETVVLMSRVDGK
jgi:23S rRNA (uracil1939-C5)-methyltransferase